MSENININRQQHNITISEPMRDYHLPIASETVLGGIKVGNNLTIEEDGTLNAESTEYILPTASASRLGGVKVGNNLTINDGVLTADVDSVLSGSSTNPLQNSTITSNINSINNTLDSLDGRLDTAEDNISNLTSSVQSNADNITTLQGNLSDLSEDVAQNTLDIGSANTNISSLSSSVSTMSSTLTTLGNTVTSQGNAIGEMSGQLNALTLSSDDEIEYSYLLPSNTWTSGGITICRRGNTAVLQFNLTGVYDIQSEVDSQIYKLDEELQNSVPCYGTLITNDGCIEVKVDSNRNIKFYNHASSTKHIIEIKGQLTIVL